VLRVGVKSPEGLKHKPQTWANRPLRAQRFRAPPTAGNTCSDVAAKSKIFKSLELWQTAWKFKRYIQT